MKLFRQSASGIELVALFTNQTVLEAAANFFYHNESSYLGEVKVDRLFALLNNGEPFYINVAKNVRANKLKEIITKNLNDFYKNDIVENHVKFY